MTPQLHPTLSMRHIRAFLTVAEARGFAAAAQSLRRSLSTVSRSVALLETALGRPLLHRGPDGQTPTPAGQAVQRRAAIIAQELAGLRDMLHRYHGADIPASSALFGMMIDCTHLRALLAVHDYRSVKRAAATLAVTQPAVSYSIRLLEADIGTPLFSRLPGGMVATPAGDSLALSISRILSEISRMFDDVRSIDGPSTGQVRVGALAYSRTALLPRAIRQVLATHPNLSIRTVEGHIDQLMAALHRGEIDVLMCAHPDPTLMDGVTAEHIVQDRLGFFVRPGHPLAAQPRVPIAEMLHYPFILPPMGTITRSLLEQFFDSHGLPPPRGRAETSSAALIRELLRGSDSIAFRSEREFADQQAAALPLNLASPAPLRDICVLQRRGAHQTAAVLAFLDEVRQTRAGV